MKPEMLLSEFLEHLQHRADEQFNGRLHQSFISWYIEAELGHKMVWYFTDGPNDAGIDAIVLSDQHDPPVTILQSKFSEKNAGKARLAGGAYDSFNSVVRAFRFGGGEFDEWLDGAADDLRKLYNKAFQKLTGVNWHTAKKAFRIVTTHTRHRQKEFGLIPEDNFVYFEHVLELYSRYRIFQTPTPPPLALTVQDKVPYSDKKRGTVSYLFNARVSDFRRYLEKTDVSRLVARNIRFRVPTGRKVARAIRGTYEKSPEEFWYLHNGLTILCDDFAEKNQTATLEAPSVVNGAQTLYAIADCPLRDTPAFVIVRAIVRGENSIPVDDDEWVQRVIRGVNTQNKVEPYDFRSNDP
jgi:hypothetical protein